MSHPRKKIEYGDFQTPDELAVACCRTVLRDMGEFSVAVEPTCGTGAFVRAVSSVMKPRKILANEVNQQYLAAAKASLDCPHNLRISWTQQDFFVADWRSVRDEFGDRKTLFIGNPPWVTNSQLGSFGGNNLPPKRNIDGVTGIEARTGHGNFDISEYMLRSIVQLLRPGLDGFAFLVKASTARKVIHHAWKNEKAFAPLSCYAIDAKREFGVNVEAVLMLGFMASAKSVSQPRSHTCLSSDSLDSPAQTVAMGWVDQKIVSDPAKAEATRGLMKIHKGLWRSGIKHDATKILELNCRDGLLTNGFDEELLIESDLLYPLLKGSDVANGRSPASDKVLLVPQYCINESTDDLSNKLPKTYAYLTKYQALFAKRKSSIYKKRDPFAVFGVGPYTWRPWKVAICGLYKRLKFSIYGPCEGRPVVFDDTIYFIGTEEEAQASLLLELLQSTTTRKFLESRIFWDSKRPITASLLQSLDLRAVAIELGFQNRWKQNQMEEVIGSRSDDRQPQLF